MSNVEHPHWCNLARCMTADLGVHESSTTRITAGRGAGKSPRILMVLQAPPAGHPVRIRMVTISDVLINSVDIDLAAAAQLAEKLNWMIGQAEQPNS